MNLDPLKFNELLRSMGGAAGLARRIDDTILRPTTTIRDVEARVEEVERYRLRAIVVPPSLVSEVSEITSVPVITVVGFPAGFTPLEVKLFEIEQAASRGAKEVDMVANIAAIKSGSYDSLAAEVSKAAEASRSLGLRLKVIIETGLLTPSEVVEASKVVALNGADYVKTCTGHGPRGVVPRDVILIRRALREVNASDSVGIKASGGIRSAYDAVLYIALGARIIGTSAGVEIVREAERLLQGDERL